MGPGISGPAIEKWCDPAARVGFDSCWVEPDPRARCSFPRHVPESNGTAQCTGKVAKTIHLLLQRKHRSQTARFRRIDADHRLCAIEQSQQEKDGYSGLGTLGCFISSDVNR